MLNRALKFLRFSFEDRRYYISLLCGLVTLCADLLFIKIFGYVEVLTIGGGIMVAFLLAIIVNFLLQKQFVFKKSTNARLSFSLFFLYWLIGAVVNILLVRTVFLFVDNVYIAQIISSGFLSILSFLVYDRFIFGTKNMINTIPFIRNKKIIFGTAIFFLAVFSRLIVLTILYLKIGDTAIIWGDTLRYLGNAQSFLAEGSFIFHNTFEVYRTPGYPFFIALFLFFKVPVFYIAVFQLILSGVIPIFVFWLLNRFHISKKILIPTLFFVIFEPLTLYYSIPLLPDVLFTVLLLVVFYLLILYFDRRNLSLIIWIATIIGILNYIRQVGIYLVYILVFYIFIESLIHKVQIRKALQHSFVLLFLVILISAPWYYRNYKHFGVWEFSSALPVNFFNYVGAGTLASAQKIPYEPARLQMMDKFKLNAPISNEHKDLRNAQYLKDETIKIILQYPLDYMKTVLLGLNTFFFSGNYHYLLLKFDFINKPEKITSYSLILSSFGVDGLLEQLSKDIFSPYVLIAILGKLFWFCITFLAFWGAFVYWRRKEAQIFLLLSLYFSMTILSVGIGVEARHRFALNPLIFVFASVIINRVYEKIINRCSCIQRRRKF